MKSPAPPHRSKHCLVPRALRQEATIYSSQKDFLRPRAAEDLLPIQKRSRFCFPPEPLRPHEEDSLTASGSKGRRVTSSESFLTSPPPLTVVRACAWWRGGQKVGPIVLCSPCPGPLQPVRLVIKESPPRLSSCVQTPAPRRKGWAGADATPGSSWPRSHVPGLAHVAGTVLRFGVALESALTQVTLLLTRKGRAAG